MGLPPLQKQEKWSFSSFGFRGFFFILSEIWSFIVEHVQCCVNFSVPFLSFYLPKHTMYTLACAQVLMTPTFYVSERVSVLVTAAQ